MYVRCRCVRATPRVSPCVDDMPMINLWPHLYATAREIDRQGEERSRGVEKRMLLSERDLESVRRARLHEALAARCRSPAVGCC